MRALARTLDAPSEITRLRVAENLERLGHPSVQPLKESLADVISLGTRELNGPVMATQVLGNLRAAEARGVLKQAARHGAETDVRAQATLALGKIGDPDDVPTLLACSRDEAWPVRAQAANALGMIGEVSSVPRLKEMGSDDAWWVRRNACFALANMGPEGEARSWNCSTVTTATPATASPPPWRPAASRVGRSATSRSPAGAARGPGTPSLPS